MTMCIKYMFAPHKCKCASKNISQHIVLTELDPSWSPPRGNPHSRGRCFQPRPCQSNVSRQFLVLNKLQVLCGRQSSGESSIWAPGSSSQSSDRGRQPGNSPAPSGISPPSARAALHPRGFGAVRTGFPAPPRKGRSDATNNPSLAPLCNLIFMCDSFQHNSKTTAHEAE